MYCFFLLQALRLFERRLSFTVRDSVPAFRVKLGDNDLNGVDVPLNPIHSLTQISVTASGLEKVPLQQSSSGFPVHFWDRWLTHLKLESGC